MHVSRRRLFAAAPAVALSACAVTTSNGTTTITLDVAKIEQIDPALLTGVLKILTFPGVAQQLGTNLLTAQAALGAANTAAASVSAQIAPNALVPIDTTSVQGGVKSVLSNIEVITGMVAPLVSLIPGGAALSALIEAIQTLASVLELAASLVSAKAGATAPGREATALKTIYGR